MKHYQHEEKEKVCELNPLIVIFFPKVTYPIMEEIICVCVFYSLQIKIGYLCCQKYRDDHVVFS
jgi:hypothetical protein